jgi:hypothetical protein
MIPSSRGRLPYRAVAEKEARAMLTDAVAAADSLWAIAHNPYASTLFFKNASAPDDVARVKALYGRFWSKAMAA